MTGALDFPKQYYVLKTLLITGGVVEEGGGGRQSRHKDIGFDFPIVLSNTLYNEKASLQPSFKRCTRQRSFETVTVLVIE